MTPEELLLSKRRKERGWGAKITDPELIARDEAEMEDFTQFKLSDGESSGSNNTSGNVSEEEEDSKISPPKSMAASFRMMPSAPAKRGGGILDGLMPSSLANKGGGILGGLEVGVGVGINVGATKRKLEIDFDEAAVERLRIGTPPPLPPASEN